MNLIFLVTGKHATRGSHYSSDFMTGLYIATTHATHSIHHIIHLTQHLTAFSSLHTQEVSYFRITCGKYYNPIKCVRLLLHTQLFDKKFLQFYLGNYILSISYPSSNN